jgi:sec-independent protein translocase protein TatA
MIHAPVNLAIFGPIGTQELIILLVIVLLVFGANKLPKIAKDLGHGIREFKKSISGEQDEKKNDSNEQKKD